MSFFFPFLLLPVAQTLLFNPLCCNLGSPFFPRPCSSSIFIPLLQTLPQCRRVAETQGWPRNTERSLMPSLHLHPLASSPRLAEAVSQCSPATWGRQLSLGHPIPGPLNVFRVAWTVRGLRTDQRPVGCLSSPFPRALPGSGAPSTSALKGLMH